MRVWKKAFNKAVDDASNRLRTKPARKDFRRFAEAHQKPVTSLLAAYAEGLIDDGTFTAAMSEERKALNAELRSAKSVRSAGVPTATLFKSLDAALTAHKE